MQPHVTHFGRLAVLAVGVLSVTGCVKRKETITISQDGAVEISLKYEGDRSDMESGAPHLVQGPGWRFSERVDAKEGKEDEDSIVREASVRIEPGAALPAVYPCDDPAAEALIVQHPTTLEIERRGDGIYYHFRRAYPARPWAYVNYWQRKLVEEPLEQSDAKSMDEMSADKKQEIVQDLIDFAAVKQIEFARRAAQQLDSPLPQDMWLDIYAAMRGVARSVDADRVLTVLEEKHASGDDEAMNMELTKLATDINGRVAEKTRATMAEAGTSSAQIDRFMAAVQVEARRFEITEDYQDEEWEIEVVMPGEIVGHNGDSAEGRTVKWEIDGNGLCDRDVELMVTSRVALIPPGQRD